MVGGPPTRCAINIGVGGYRHNTKFVVRRQNPTHIPRPSDRLVQWRREAPPRRLRPTPSPPSSVSVGGGPKDDGIYCVTTSTPSPWMLPYLLPPTTVETLNSHIYVSLYFYSVRPIISNGARRNAHCDDYLRAEQNWATLASNWL